MLKPNAGVENGLSTIGAVLWTVQIIPQIVKSYRTKSTLGLSASLMAVWAFSSYPFSSYIVAQRLAIPLQIQPHVFGFLCAVSWMQCLHYGNGTSKARTVFYFGVFILVWAGFETGSVFALWTAEDRDIDAPAKVYGYLSAVMLAAALLPQYWEIYKLKQVVGISLIFMAVDILGGIFSLLSLFFREKIDVAACVSYGLVVVLDSVVVILAFILNPLAKHRQARDQDTEEVSPIDMETSAPLSPISKEAKEQEKETINASGSNIHNGDVHRIHDVEKHPPLSEAP